MKKILIWLLAVVFIFSIIFIVGCKVTPSEATTAAETTEAATTAAEATTSGEKITLEFWSWNTEGDYPKVHEEDANRFMADNPNVEIKRTYIGGNDFHIKVKTIASGGTLPDIIQGAMIVNSSTPGLESAGMLVDLTELSLQQGFPKFYPSAVKEITLDGKVWGIMLDLNTLQIAYNENMFKQLGLEIPKSQDELKSLVQKLKDNGKYCLAVGTKDQWVGVDLFFAQLAYLDPDGTLVDKADKGEISWNQPEFVQAAQNVLDLIKAEVFAPGANSMDSFVGAKDLFTSQQAAMFYPVGNFITGGITSAIAGAFDYTLFPTPPLKAGDEFYPTGGGAEAFCITKDCKHPDIALKFLQYMTDDKGKDTLVKYDFIPSSDYNGDLSSKSDLSKNMLNAQSKFKRRCNIQNQEVSTVMLSSIQGLMGQELTAQQFIDTLVKAAEKK